MKAKFGKTSTSLKIYEKDCLQIFIFLFMSLLPTKFVKNSHIWSKIYFIFLKKYAKTNSKFF